MKKIFRILVLFLLCSEANAQILFGSHWNGNSEISTKLNTPTKFFTSVDTLVGIDGIGQGETAFDHVNGRYFNLTPFDIKVIDAFSGIVIDSIPNTVRMYGIEYNNNTGKLFGVSLIGSTANFVTLDLTTKTFSNIAALNSIKSLVQGETAYDAVNQIYFNMTVDNINVIDAQTGIILDSIPNTIRMKGMEFNVNTGKIIGSHWTGTNEVFTELDISTHTFSNIGTLIGVHSIVQGETAFDAANNKYFNITDLDITVIDVLTGTIIDTIANSIRLKGIELYYLAEPVVSTNGGIIFSPNPADDKISIEVTADMIGSTFYITDLTGSKVVSAKLTGTSTSVDVSNLKSGFYIIRNENSGGTRMLKR